MTRLPELLAPISTFETCQAAVHNGADAVYVGVPHWNARGRTPDLSLEDLRHVIEFCRLRKVRVFFAMNVLVFESELQGLPEYLAELVRLEPDAFIVQDIGLVRLLHQICAEQEVHASTQMTLASGEAVDCVQDLGMARVVLARELSLEEIREIRARTRSEIEVFTHGALCVSYSGQCLTSESFGGRSANRGQCAQSCRLPYQLIVDGKNQELQGRNYLFSPQDLCALELVGDLSKAGVDSLKIEGRLKSAEYVAAVTAAYRTALDTGSWNDKQLDTLEALFSRGMFTGWLKGTDHQKLVNGHYSSHQGVQIGIVERVVADGVIVRLERGAPQCVPGDGLVFVDDRGPGELGGRLYGIKPMGAGLVHLAFSHGLDLRRIKTRWQVWRNDSPSLEADVRRSFTDRDHWRRVPVQMVVAGGPHEPLQLTIEDPEGHRVVERSSAPLEAARESKPDAYAWIEEEIGALAATPYRLANHGNELKPGAFVPRKLLRELRQKACAAMDAERLRWKPLQIHGRENVIFPKGNRPVEKQALLNLLVRKESQLFALQPGLAIDTIYLDFDYGRKHDQAMQQIRELGYRTGISTLRIHKTVENRYLETIAKHNPDQILVRSLGALHWLQNRSGLTSKLVGDHSLNISNSLCAEWFQLHGLDLLHPSWDLNRQQMLDLLKQYGGASFELGLHLYIPTYHMEHCVFAAFLSKGSKYPDCKVPCMVHQVEVEDHKGEKHYLQSDAECRNTLYLGRPQSMVKLVPDLLREGVRRFRIEMLQESAQQVQDKVQAYSDLLRGKFTAEQVFRQLGVAEKYGITEGQLFNETRWIDRKQNR